MVYQTCQILANLLVEHGGNRSVFDPLAQFTVQVSGAAVLRWREPVRESGDIVGLKREAGGRDGHLTWISPLRLDVGAVELTWVIAQRIESLYSSWGVDPLKRLKHGSLASLVRPHQNRLGMFDLEPIRVTDAAVVLHPHVRQSHCGSPSVQSMVMLIVSSDEIIGPGRTRPRFPMTFVLMVVIRESCSSQKVRGIFASRTIPLMWRLRWLRGIAPPNERSRSGVARDLRADSISAARFIIGSCRPSGYCFRSSHVPRSGRGALYIS